MPVEFHSWRQVLMPSLLIVTACLVAVSLVDAIVVFETAWVKLVMDRLRLDSERSLSAFFAFTLLLITSALLTLIAIAKAGSRDHWRWHWAGLAGLFLLLAYDEAASFHEMLIEPLREALDLDGFLYFAWVIPGATVVVCVFLLYLPFLMRLPRRFALLFLAAGAIYVGGALGMETISASHFSSERYHHRSYHLMTTFEETLEMAGLLLFIDALLRYIETGVRAVRIVFASPPGHGSGPRLAGGPSVRERPAP